VLFIWPQALSIAGNDQLKAEVVTLKNEMVVKDAAIVLLTAENASKTQEIDVLTASIAAKDTTIAQLQQGGSSSGIAFLQARNKQLEKDFEKLHEDYQLEFKEKHEAWDSLRALQSPQAVGGSYKRVLALLDSAAAVTDRKNEWDQSVCNNLATEMVKGMLSSAEAGKDSVVKDHVAKVVWSGIYVILFTSDSI